MNKLLRKQIKDTTGKNWFDMPAPTITPELKRDLQLLKLRGAMDPKRHYKKSGSKSKTLPKYFQVGTVIEPASEYYSGRLTKKERKTTLTEELLSDRKLGEYRRVLSVDKPISFAELMVKFGESCGSSISLKCKLPTEDLDVLVSITCDEDLMNVIQEYDRVSALTNQEMKIRAVLFPLNSVKKVSPPSSPMSCFDFPASRMKPEKLRCFYSPPSYAAAATARCCSPALGYPVGGRKDGDPFGILSWQKGLEQLA